MIAVGGPNHLGTNPTRDPHHQPQVQTGSGAQPRASAASSLATRGVILRSEDFDDKTGKYTTLTLQNLLKLIQQRQATQVEIHEGLFLDLSADARGLIFNSVRKVKVTGYALGASGSPINNDEALVAFLKKLHQYFPKAKLYHENQVWSSSYANTQALTTETRIPFASQLECYNPSKAQDDQKLDSSSGGVFEMDD